MPLCWRGLAIFPDGLGPVLAAALENEPGLQRNLHDIVNNEVQGIWAAMREERGTFRATAPGGKAAAGGAADQGTSRRVAAPDLHAQSHHSVRQRTVGGRWITNLSDLAPALDAIATASPDADLLEPRIAAFIGARSERLLDSEVQALGNDGDTADRVLVTLKLLTELQNRFHPAVMKGVTAWIAARSQPLVERWKNRERRAAVDAATDSAGRGGLPAADPHLVAGSGWTCRGPGGITLGTCERRGNRRGVARDSRTAAHCERRSRTAWVRKSPPGSALPRSRSL